MFEPHGGKLIDRIISHAEGDDLKKRAHSLPSLTLNARETSDLRMISIGAFSPIEGFMNSADYRGVVERAALANGLPWTIPVTLSTDKATADHLKPGAEVALKTQEGAILGSLTVEDKFGYDKAKEAQNIFRTTDEAHPGVAVVMKQGEVLLGGKVKAFAQQPLPVYADSDRTPAQTRALFKEQGWNTVVGFQTRNPIHRAHEYIMKCALELVDGLMVHPLVGETKAGDTDAEVRMRCYHALLGKYYPATRTLLSTFPASMRYAGPKEAIFHAICRKNYGCTNFIVGRDHAGVGTYYGSYDAQKIFGEFDAAAIGIRPMFFENSFFCKACGNMGTAKTCPHLETDRINLSGTKVREMLAAGQRPPSEFTRAEVADILIEAAKAAPVKSG
ncbi:MAG: sulfate adenylyltransferase [Dehalococcoidia bacterium]|nr:sulfate adenylyltransferase [Dehalococcoidia bacterium]MSQ34979.1 sulfate adenylyltransferase [Dehalococcoidia bacterium]